MLDRKLKEFQPWSNAAQKGEFILLIDNNPVGGEFIFNALLASNISRPGNNIVFLVCGNNQTHYEYILRKNGIDSSVNGIKNVKFIVLEKLSAADGNLFSLVQSEISNLSALGQVILMIDDLLALDLWLENTSECSSGRSFISCVHSLAMSLTISQLVVYGKAYASNMFPISETLSNIGSFNASRSFSANLVTDSCEEQCLPLYIYCLFRADMICLVAPLSTGYAADVHGQIIISNTRSCRSEHVLIYRALDTGVNCGVIDEKV